MKETALEVFVDTADPYNVKVKRPDGTIVELEAIRIVLANASTGTLNDITSISAGLRATTIRCTGVAPTINGIDHGVAGRRITILATGGDVILAHEAGGSTAANRIVTSTAASVTITNGAAAMLEYDGTTSRWRIVGIGIVGAGGGGEANTASNLGAGANVFTAKSGVNLPFRSIITTSPLRATQNANDITIDLPGLTGFGTDGQSVRKAVGTNTFEWYTPAGGGGGAPPAGTGIAAVVGGAWDTTVSYGAAGTYLRSNGGGVSSFSNISASEIFSIPGSSGDLLVNVGGAIGASSTLAANKIASLPGSDKFVFFNDGGAWGAHSGFQYNKSTGAIIGALFEYSATKVIANSDGTSCFVGTSSSYTNQHDNVRVYASNHTYLGTGSTTYVDLGGGAAQINAGASGMAFYAYNTDTTVQAPGASAGITFTATQTQFGVSVGGHSGGLPFHFERANVVLSGGGPTSLSNAAQRCPDLTFSGTPTAGHLVQFLEQTGSMWLVYNTTAVTIRLGPYGGGNIASLGAGLKGILVCPDGANLFFYATPI